MNILNLLNEQHEYREANDFKSVMYLHGYYAGYIGHKKVFERTKDERYDMGYKDGVGDGANPKSH